MSSNKKYHAFISYSHRDKPYAAAIQKSIETLGLPFYKSWQPDVNIFRDERKIPLAGSLTEQIITGLKESEYLIVIASKNSANSTWVREEILNWHKLNKDEDGYITNFNFILTDDIIEWDYLNQDFDKLKTTALPSFDKKIFKELPLWANLQQYCKSGKVQSSNSNYEWEIAKVKGFLLGKKPDEIIDEVSKGKRLFRIITGLIISVLLLLSGFAFYQQSNALKQKKIADKNALEATTQRDSANYQKAIALKKAKEAKAQRDTAVYQKGIAILNANEAKSQRDLAVFQKGIALSQSFANIANYYSEKDPTISLSLAMNSLKINRENTTAKIALLKAFNTNSWYYSNLWEEQSDATLSKDGRFIALLSNKDSLSIIDRKTQKTKRFFHKGSNVDFLPNNNIIVWSSWEGKGTFGDFILMTIDGEVIAKYQFEFLRLTVCKDGTILIPAFKDDHQVVNRINPNTGNLESLNLPVEFKDLGMNCNGNSDIVVVSSQFPTSLAVLASNKPSRSINISSEYYIENIDIRGDNIAYYMIGNRVGVKDCVGIIKNASSNEKLNQQTITLKYIDEFDHSGSVHFLSDDTLMASATNGWSKIFSLSSDYNYEIENKRTADEIVLLPKSNKFIMAQRSGEITIRNFKGIITDELIGNEASDGGNPSFYKVLIDDEENSILTVTRYGIRLWNKRTPNLKIITTIDSMPPYFKTYFSSFLPKSQNPLFAEISQHTTSTLVINSLGQVGLNFSLNGNDAVFQTELMKNVEDVYMLGPSEKFAFCLHTYNAERYFILSPDIVYSIILKEISNKMIWNPNQAFIEKWIDN